MNFEPELLLTATCPSCSGPGATVTRRLTANPRFSLAGSTMKVSARLRPVLKHESCGLCVVGEFEGGYAVFDNAWLLL